MNSVYLWPVNIALLLLSLSSFAQDQTAIDPIKDDPHHDEHHHEYTHLDKHSSVSAAHSDELNQEALLEEVTVTSTASNRSLNDIAKPITVLSADDLSKRSGDTLGAILANTPGVANASFGQGVGRPVLRGMGGKRVKVMQNGLDASDLSAMSSDHGTMVDPVNADQVEIIQGPSTLLFGGGAIGGVVNVVKQQIYTQTYSGFDGQVTSRYSSADNGKQVTAVLNAGFDNFIVHLEAFGRKTDDYEVGNNDNFGEKALNSDVEGAGGNLALSWIFEEKGYLGFSVSNLTYDYGVPNSANEPARVTPEQMRYELVGAWFDPFSFIHEWKTELAYTDYEHDEKDGDIAVGLFQQASVELKSMLTHHPLYIGDAEFNGSVGVHLTQSELAVCHSHQGCSDIADYSERYWDGKQGVNLISSGGYLFSHDTPMPESATSNIGVFWLEEMPWSKGVVELGLRYDNNVVSTETDAIRPDYRQQLDYYDDKNFNLYAINWAATWVLNDSNKLGLSLARAERAPDAQEMYWNGAHHSTFSYQLDNPDLGKETANTINLNWIYSIDAIETSVTGFYYLFDGYIYNDLKSINDPYHGEDVYRHEQADAYFTGLEFLLHWDLDQHASGVSIDVFADTVTARLRDGSGENLPRIPPASLGSAINWVQGKWSSSFDVRAFSKQGDVAENESETDGYVTANMMISYEQPLAKEQMLWIRLKGVNLSDEYALNHASYLKREAPIVGRNVSVEVGYKF